METLQDALNILKKHNFPDIGATPKDYFQIAEYLEAQLQSFQSLQSVEMEQGIAGIFEKTSISIDEEVVTDRLDKWEIHEGFARPKSIVLLTSKLLALISAHSLKDKAEGKEKNNG